MYRKQAGTVHIPRPNRYFDRSASLVIWQRFYLIISVRPSCIEIVMMKSLWRLLPALQYTSDATLSSSLLYKTCVPELRWMLAPRFRLIVEASTALQQRDVEAAEARTY